MSCALRFFSFIFLSVQLFPVGKAARLLSTHDSVTGSSAFHLLAKYGGHDDLALFRVLLSLAPSFISCSSLVNDPDGQGNTPLILATQRCAHTFMMALVLELEAQIDLMNHAGLSALHVAVQEGLPVRG